MLRVLCILSLLFLWFKLYGGYITKFTNVKWETYDESYLACKRFDLKVVKRGRIAMNVHVALLQVPVDNITLKLQMFKKANYYLPFLINEDFSFCRVLKNRHNPSFSSFLLKEVFAYSNFNHNCPFNHDIIIRDYEVAGEFYQYFPIPTGDYLVAIKMSTNNLLKAGLKIYVNIQE